MPRPLAIVTGRQLIAMFLVLVSIGHDTCHSYPVNCHGFLCAQDEFPDSYVPTVFENHVTQLDLDGELVEMNLWDTGVFLAARPCCW
jgi:Ras family protein